MRCAWEWRIYSFHSSMTMARSMVLPLFLYKHVVKETGMGGGCVVRKLLVFFLFFFCACFCVCVARAGDRCMDP